MSDALDNWICIPPRKRTSGMLHEAWLAMWRRIGNDYAIGVCLSVAFKYPLRDGTLVEATDEQRRHYREQFAALGITVGGGT